MSSGPTSLPVQSRLKIGSQENINRIAGIPPRKIVTPSYGARPGISNGASPSPNIRSNSAIDLQAVHRAARNIRPVVSSGYGTTLREFESNQRPIYRRISGRNLNLDFLFFPFFIFSRVYRTAPPRKETPGVADSRTVTSPDHRNSRNRSRTSGATQSQRKWNYLAFVALSLSVFMTVTACFKVLRFLFCISRPQRVWNLICGLTFCGNNSWKQIWFPVVALSLLNLRVSVDAYPARRWQCHAGPAEASVGLWNVQFHAYARWSEKYNDQPRDESKSRGQFVAHEAEVTVKHETCRSVDANCRGVNFSFVGHDPYRDVARRARPVAGRSWLRRFYRRALKPRTRYPMPW